MTDPIIARPVFAVFLFLVSSLFVSLFFLADFLKTKKVFSLLKSIAFGLFAASSGVTLFNQSRMTDTSFWLTAVGMLSLYASLVLDKHSSLRYTLPLPFLFLLSPIFTGHKLLLALSVFDLIAILELAYNESHRKLLPFISAFTCIVVAEYFYSYWPIFAMNLFVGSVLYAFASLIFFLFVFNYLIRKLISIIRGRKY